MKLRKLTAVIWLVALCVALSSICVPAFAADSGAEVYYTSEPTVSGNTVSAKVMNTSGSDVMFIAAAYSGDALTDAAVKTVPSGGETAVSATLNGAANGVKCYLWSDNSIAPHGEPVAAAPDKLPAFPGAEGGGMWTTGARGGSPEVYHVYKLTDDGSYGTFRDAVSQPNRIIVFDVAGNIELTDTLTIKADNLTILGQTAPGMGVCVKNCNTDITGNNVILRYMRFRMGDEKTMEEDTIGSRGRHNIIVDHCSFSWSVDECASFYEVTDFTMQWCIVAESLKHSVHAKEAHGYAGIWGGTNASFHHNLLAHHDSRNPRIAEGPFVGQADYDMSAQTSLTDLRNNVIYNWGGNSAYGGQGAAAANIINSYYKYGPSTSNRVRSRIFQTTSTGNDITSPWSTDIYVDGNYVDGNAEVTADNSKGVDEDSSASKKYIWTKNNITDEAKAVHFKYENDYPVTTQTAEEAYQSVLESAGASIARDSADQRVIDDTKNRTGIKLDKKYDDNGVTKTDTTYGIISSPSDVGGYPELTGTKSKDSDGDGMPNEWEDKNGLDKNNADDGLAISASGYTNLEVYANALADKSYTPDPAYDPDAKDFDPSVNEPEPSTGPSSQPTFELVNEWKAASGDEKKAAGTEFMPGLVGMTQLERAMTDEKEYSDGFKHNFAITCKNTNGGWADGKATGCAMKYTAPESGRFTIYAYGVSVKNPPTMFYAVPEGAADPATENIYNNPIDEANKKVLCQINVEAGKSYYFYIAGGSKTRFMGAKLERYVTPAEPQYEIASEWKAASGDENKAAGTEFMPGLVGMTQLERAMTDEKEYSDGFKHNFAITCKNTNGGWADGKATGCAMKYTAPESGRFTIYAYGVSVKDPPTMFYAVPEGAADPATENIYNNPIDEANKKVLCQINVEAGKSYYFYIAGGSKTRFMGAKLERPKN